MYPKVAADPSQYDVLCPSDYMIAKMSEEGLLAELSMEDMPEAVKNIGKEYWEMSRSFDPENKYSVPYCWGTVGILYNTTMVDDPVDSWEILWNEKYADDILMQDSVRDAFMIPEKMLGYDINTVNEDEIAAAAQLLMDQKRSRTVVKGPKIGRNDPCPCGSGKKYKFCCGKSA